MSTLRTAVYTLFPVVTEIEAEQRTTSKRPAPRGSGLLGQVVAIACALTPLLVMVEAYIQTA